MAEAGRPPTAFCACELRSPAPFTEDGFRAFNQVYVVTLERWGIFREGDNPVARRTSVRRSTRRRSRRSTPSRSRSRRTAPLPSFVIAGWGEAQEGRGSYRERTVRRGETSPDAMRDKARFVLGEMERRMALLGFAWRDTTAAQVYTVHDLHPFLGDEIVARGAARSGLTWHFCRPPVAGLEYEMDCRAVAREDVV